MKMRLLTTAALSLGLSALVPSFAKADHYEGRLVEEHRYDDHRDVGYRPVPREVRVERDVRVERVYAPVVEVRRDCDVPVSLAEVPARVIDTAERSGNGRRIESVRLERHNGRTTYVVHMERGRKEDIVLRVEPDGDLLAIDRTGLVR
jgi:uncharacterized membrane protein YkoI